MATLGFCCLKLSFEDKAMFLVREDETNPKELFRSASEDVQHVHLDVI